MLVKSTIQEEIKTILNSMSEVEDKDAALEMYSSKLADVIINAIKSASITIPPGGTVQVIPTTGSGAITQVLVAQIK
jgi:ABC-type antimicrobial peptide transport system ATPase subunit